MKTRQEENEGTSCIKEVRPYTNISEIKKDFEYNIDDFYNRKPDSQMKSIFYQDSIKDAIQVIIEKLDEHIFESDAESANHSRKPSFKLNHFDMYEQIQEKDTPIIVNRIMNYTNISQILPSRIGTNRPCSLDLTDNAILMNLNKLNGDNSTPQVRYQKTS